MKKSLIFLAALAVAAVAGLAHAAGVDIQAVAQPLQSPEGLTGLGLAAGAAFGTTKYKQRGVVLDYVAGAAIASGKMVLVGTTRVGIALGAIANGATGSVQLGGVFTYAKLGTDVVTQGQALYYDTANDRLTTTVGTNTPAGFAFSASAGGVATVDVMLNGIPG